MIDPRRAAGQAGLLVVAAQQPQYRDVETAKPVADIWIVLGQGVLR